MIRGSCNGRFLGRAPIALVALVALAALAVLAGASDLARAEPDESSWAARDLATSDLTIRQLPLPTTLRMRPAMRSDTGEGRGAGYVSPAGSKRVAQGTDESASEQADIARRRLAQWLAPRPGRLRPALQDQVVFRFNLGFGLDGADPTPSAELLSGAELSEPAYSRLRLYYFGDAIIGSRGLVAPSLSSYFAAQFRFDQGNRPCVELGSSRCANAIASIEDGRDVDHIRIRSAYAQSDGFFTRPLLAPIFVRAGRQYRYGPAVAHFDGITVGYDTPALSFGAFAGQGVNLYGISVTGEDDPESLVLGLDARVAIYERWRLPLLWSGSLLRFAGRTHLQGNLALQWSQDVAIRAGARTLSGRLARTTLQVRARISEVTTVSFEAEGRTDADWMYDLFTIRPTTSSTDPRRYLDLGPPLPRVYATLRAGTVLFDNIDVLIRGGAAREHADGDVTPNPHATSFIEGGGAVELRPRRAVAVALSGLVRRYSREPDDFQENAGDGLPDPLPPHAGRSGERSFAEGGASIRYTQGARRLTARAEVYGRYYSILTGFAGDPLPDNEVRYGGRFGLDIWPSDRLRLKGEYDVSSSLELAPEIRGYKSLRIIAEGRF